MAFDSMPDRIHVLRRLPMTNERIAELVGFKRMDKDAKFPEGWSPDLWQYPLGFYYDHLPDFLHSMDACIKWIVPVLIRRGIFSWEFIYKTDGVLAMCELHCGINVVHGIGETESEAFCSAAYKYLSEVRK
jgi:hypothetical protein